MWKTITTKHVNPSLAFTGTPQCQKAAGLDYLATNLKFKCNFACKKCFNGELPLCDKARTKLGAQDYRALVEQAREAGAKTIVLSGLGEPLLDRNAKSIVEWTFKNNMTSIIYTNGTSLTKDNNSFLIDNNASVAISLDSLDRKTFGFLTGRPDFFQAVKQNIENAVKSFSGNEIIENGKKIVRVAIITTIQWQNRTEFATIAGAWKGQVVNIFNSLSNSGRAAKNWSTLTGGQDERYSRMADEAVRQYSGTGGPLTLMDNGICAYSYHGIAIDYNGLFKSCAYTGSLGLVGHFPEITLMAAYEKKHRIETAFYQKYGPCPCILRGGKFHIYDGMLKGQQL